mmetsp:Transcript_13147/g.28356  ORF Transcript_13147/g.28356 Transcript_13147/m.28356 type:complete len:239 (-) Transcript_13147:402-1118(-)
MLRMTNSASRPSATRMPRTARHGCASSTAPPCALARSTTWLGLSFAGPSRTSSPSARASVTASVSAQTQRRPSSASGSRRRLSSPGCSSTASLTRPSWSRAVSLTSLPLASAAATANAPRPSPRGRASGARLRRSCSTDRSCRAPSPARTSRRCSRRRGWRPSSRSSRASTRLPSKARLPRPLSTSKLDFSSWSTRALELCASAMVHEWVGALQDEAESRSLLPACSSTYSWSVVVVS